MARILVVDDDPLICSAMQTWLENNGFEVVVADGGRVGLNVLERSAFDLMVIDIFMPGMDGFESIRTFHQHAPEVPIIATSGLTFREHHGPAPDFLGMATHLGAAHCLRKPFKAWELVEAIDQCLSEPIVRRKIGTTPAKSILLAASMRF
jgi:CheY-like chemotaxis protein